MKICVFTGTRAEYGLLRPLMDQLNKDSSFELQIIASGMHLSEKFGMTYKEIEKDGFAISEKIEILADTDDEQAICKAIGSGVDKFAEALKRLNPDLIVILGDRFEALAMATAAMVARVPIAHLNGGEATYGVIDEPIRHSITKMSHLHLTATEDYRNRVVQLGENPEMVFNVGSIGIDNIRRMSLLSKEDLEKELDFKFGSKNILVTFHPLTLEEKTEQEQFSELLKAVDNIQNLKIIFTKANADTGGSTINHMIDEYVQKNNDKAAGFVSMGQLKYLSTMQYVDAVVGNSSSGIIEAPSFKTGTINIGDRQKGRLKPDTVIDCLPKKNAIEQALSQLWSDEFQNKLKSTVNPYGDGNTAERVIEIIKRTDFHNILKKQFYDLPVTV